VGHSAAYSVFLALYASDGVVHVWGVTFSLEPIPFPALLIITSFGIAAEHNVHMLSQVQQMVMNSIAVRLF